MIKLKIRLMHSLNCKNMVGIYYLEKISVKKIFKHTVLSKFCGHPVVKVSFKNVYISEISNPFIEHKKILFFSKEINAYATVTSKDLNGLNPPCPKIGSAINPYPQDYLHHKGVLLKTNDMLNKIFAENCQPVTYPKDLEGNSYYDLTQLEQKDIAEFPKLFLKLNYQLNYNNEIKLVKIIIPAIEKENNLLDNTSDVDSCE